MKAPVGLLSDRTVLRNKMEGLCPDKFKFGELRKSEVVNLQRRTMYAYMESNIQRINYYFWLTGTDKHSFY